jgi:phospholipase C
VCGDLASAFDFASPNAAPFPELPQVSGSAAIIAAIGRRPKPAPPATPETLFQEPGLRPSRALPYELHVQARSRPEASHLSLTFRNTGRMGAVLHVYDRLHLDRIPRRYTVEAGKSLADDWPLHADGGRYDLWVYGPNGFLREFRGSSRPEMHALPEVELEYDLARRSIRMVAINGGQGAVALEVRANAYRTDGPWLLRVVPGQPAARAWALAASHNWYDFTVAGQDFERRFAGRLECGVASFSDPAV